MNWKTVELMGYAHYAAKGYRILVPLASGEGYDFVAEKDGVFLRVNVKTAGKKDKTDTASRSISLASGSLKGKLKQSKVVCDVFLAYIPEQDRFVELSGDFFASTNSKSRRIPQHLIS
jgi:hypothetical protein